MKYVAVIVRKDGLPSARVDHSWTAFTGDTEAEVVNIAHRIMSGWYSKDEYTIVLAKVYGEVEIVKYKVKPR